MLDFKFQESQLVFKHFQIFLNLCNRLHNTCNRLPVFLNVLIFKFKHEESHILMYNRLHYNGNRLPVTDFEKYISKSHNSSSDFFLKIFSKVTTF